MVTEKVNWDLASYHLLASQGSGSMRQNKIYFRSPCLLQTIPVPSDNGVVGQKSKKLWEWHLDRSGSGHLHQLSPREPFTPAGRREGGMSMKHGELGGRTAVSFKEGTVL